MANPPKWIVKLLRFFCSDRFIDELEGDLHEFYERNFESYGKEIANRKYLWDVLFSFRLYRVKIPSKLGIQPMIKFNLLITFRHGIKNLSFSLINILGLSLGIASAFYISLYILKEQRIDKFHEHKSDLYRVLIGDKKSSTTPSLLGEMINHNFPEVKICRLGKDPIKIGEKHPLFIEDFFWTDSTFFSMFSFPLLKGNARTCLKEPNSLVLTNSLAQQLFLDEEVLGSIIDIKIYDSDEIITMKITGIVEDPGANSSIQFKALGAMHNAENMYADLVKTWGFNWLTTYVYAPNSNSNFAKVDFPTIITKHLKENNQDISADLQPFENMYLRSQDISKNKLEGNIEVLYIMGSIGILILLISLINFINLNTAMVSTRLGEFKIKQILGSSSINIVWQYLIEALFYVCVSAMIGLVSIMIFEAYLNQIFKIKLSLSLLSIAEWGYLLIVLIGIGFCAGLVSGLKLIKVIIGQKERSLTKYKETKTGGRKVLMGIQYIITLFLTTTSILVYMQFKFMSNYDLGFDSEKLIYIAIDDRELQGKIGTIKTEMQKIVGVKGVAASGEKLPSAMNNTFDLSWPGLNNNEKHGIDVVCIDKDYFNVVGISFVEGEPFIHDYLEDSTRSVILNEQAKILIGDSAVLGKQIMIGGINCDVRAIVRNHHTTSLYSKITPIAYFVCPPGSRVSPDNLYIRVETQNLATLQERLADVWSDFSNDPINLNFVDQGFARSYQREERLMLLTSSLTIIAIIISFLGLFGLITFVVQQKLKELCIRKILGASILNLTTILSKDFLTIFAISITISSPMAFLFGQKWLANYPYNIGFKPIILLTAILTCLFVSAVVIGIKILKLFRVNPSNILRNN